MVERGGQFEHFSLLTFCPVLFLKGRLFDHCLLSGVTTDPADPAMRGARGPMGAQNYGIN